jgi:hypothetical protein
MLVIGIGAVPGLIPAAGGTQLDGTDNRPTEGALPKPADTG